MARTESGERKKERERERGGAGEMGRFRMMPGWSRACSGLAQAGSVLFFFFDKEFFLFLFPVFKTENKNRPKLFINFFLQKYFLENFSIIE